MGLYPNWHNGIECYWKVYIVQYQMLLPDPVYPDLPSFMIQNNTEGLGSTIKDTNKTWAKGDLFLPIDQLAWKEGTSARTFYI